MYSWSNIKRVLFSIAKLLSYMYTYTHTTNKVNFSLCSVHLRDVFFTLCVYIATGIHTGSLLIIPLLCAISPLYPAREPKHAHATWPTVLPSLCFTIIASGQGKSIHGSLYLWGHSIQEMGGNVVIGCSIYGVVVINGSLYS